MSEERTKVTECGVDDGTALFDAGQHVAVAVGFAGKAFPQLHLREPAQVNFWGHVARELENVPKGGRATKREAITLKWVSAPRDYLNVDFLKGVTWCAGFSYERDIALCHTLEKTLCRKGLNVF